MTFANFHQTSLRAKPQIDRQTIYSRIHGRGLKSTNSYLESTSIGAKSNCDRKLIRVDSELCLNTMDTGREKAFLPMMMHDSHNHHFRVILGDAEKAPTNE